MKAWVLISLAGALLGAGHGSAPVPKVAALAEAIESPAEPSARRIYQVARQRSELRVRVDAAGLLARLGHTHVVGGAVIDGCIVIAQDPQMQPSVSQSAFQLRIEVGQMEVDRPDWLVAEGLSKQPSAKAIAATRRNMLSAKVLDQIEFPHITIHSLQISGPLHQADARVLIELVGQSRAVQVPVAVSLDDDLLQADAQMTLRPSEFGIQPFKALGGALRVADELAVRVRIIARAKPTDQSAAGDSGACQPSQSNRV